MAACPPTSPTKATSAALIEADLVDVMVALPGQLFYRTQIPVCLWFLAKSKAARVIKISGEAMLESFRECRRLHAISARTAPEWIRQPV